MSVSGIIYSMLSPSSFFIFFRVSACNLQSLPCLSAFAKRKPMKCRLTKGYLEQMKRFSSLQVQFRSTPLDS